MKYIRSPFFRSDFTDSDAEKFEILRKLRQKGVKYYEPRDWPAKCLQVLRGEVSSIDRWFWKSLRTRYSYMGLVTIDSIYNSGEHCKVSGLVCLSRRFTFLISRRPPFVSHRTSGAINSFPKRYTLYSTDAYIQILTNDAVLHSSKGKKNSSFRKMWC
jgi:hypothetical protein